MPFDASLVSAAMDAPEVLIDLDLGLGIATAEACGCDLTEAYVLENIGVLHVTWRSARWAGAASSS